MWGMMTAARKGDEEESLPAAELRLPRTVEAAAAVPSSPSSSYYSVPESTFSGGYHSVPSSLSASSRAWHRQLAPPTPPTPTADDPSSTADVDDVDAFSLAHIVPGQQQQQQVAAQGSSVTSHSSSSHSILSSLFHNRAMQQALAEAAEPVFNVVAGSGLLFFSSQLRSLLPILSLSEVLMTMSHPQGGRVTARRRQQEQQAPSHSSFLDEAGGSDRRSEKVLRQQYGGSDGMVSSSSSGLSVLHLLSTSTSPHDAVSLVIASVPLLLLLCNAAEVVGRFCSAFLIANCVREVGELCGELMPPAYRSSLKQQLHRLVVPHLTRRHSHLDDSHQHSPTGDHEVRWKVFIALLHNVLPFAVGYLLSASILHILWIMKGSMMMVENVILVMALQDLLPKGVGADVRQRRGEAAIFASSEVQVVKLFLFCWSAGAVIVARHPWVLLCSVVLLVVGTIPVVLQWRRDKKEASECQIPRHQGNLEGKPTAAAEEAGGLAIGRSGHRSPDLMIERLAPVGGAFSTPPLSPAAAASPLC